MIEQWINEISGTAVLIFSITLGSILIKRYKRSSARLLLYFGITCLSIGMIFLIFPLRLVSLIFPGLPIASFLYTQIPPSGAYVFVALFTYVWIGITVLCATLLGAELLVPREMRKIQEWKETLKKHNNESDPQKKGELLRKERRIKMNIEKEAKDKKDKHNDSLAKSLELFALRFKIGKPRLWFIIPVSAVTLLWEVLLFFGPNSYLNPITEPEIVGDTSFRLFSPPFWIMMLFALYLLIFLGLGCLYRASHSPSILGKNLKFVATGVFLMILVLVFEGTPDIGDSIEFLVTMRILMILGLLLWNEGLKRKTKRKMRHKLPTSVQNLEYYISNNLELMWNNVKGDRTIKKLSVTIETDDDKEKYYQYERDEDGKEQELEMR